MSIYRVLLEPLGPFHEGAQGRAPKSCVVAHSDALHGALVAAAAAARSPVLNAARELRVSSIFPFWKDLWFYPRPMTHLPGAESGADATGRKRWKGVRLVSQGLLRAWLAGDPSAAKAEMLPSGAACLPEERKSKASLPDDFFARDASPAIAVDRVSAAAGPFRRRLLRFHKSVGLWFLAQVDDALAPALENIIGELGGFGLGGERSAGFGQFSVIAFERVTPESLWSAVTAPNAFMTLSLYLPTSDEVADGVLDAPAAYDCAVRGGYIHSRTGTGLLKRPIRMCLEGGVFPGRASGMVADVKPLGEDGEALGHPVYRSGLVMPIPFHLRQGGAAQ